MAEIASAYVSLIPSARNWGSQINRQVSGQLGATGRGIGSKLGGAIGRYAKIGAAAGIAGAGAAIFSGLKSAAGLQQITTQTAAVLKSTGGAAGVTAKQVRDLANEINNYSTLDDDAVQQGENLLLTFRDIRNEAGRGNDIFTQTTKIMADMSVALGQDTKSSALQLGKALNDPVRGVTALQRVGVSFTEKQRDQIKTLVDSGKTMEAQKLILRELNKEFGGSAKKAGSTFAGAMFHLKDALQDMLRDALIPLLPYLTKAAEWLGKVLPKAMQGLIGWVKGVIRSFSGGGGMGGAVSGVTGFLKSLGDAFVSIAQAYGPPLIGFLKTFAKFIGKNVVPILKGVVDFIAKDLAPALGKVLGAAFDGLKSAIKTISDTIQDHRKELGDLFNAFKQVGKFILGVIVPVLQTVLPVAFRILGMAISGAILIIAGIIRIFQGLWGIAKAVVGFFSGPFIGGIKAVFSAFSGAVRGVASAAGAAFGAVRSAASSAVGGVKSVFGGLVSFLSRMPGRIADAARGMWDGIKDAFKAVINTVIGWWNDFSFGLHIPSNAVTRFLHLAGKGFTVNTPDIPKLAKGGIVTKPTVALIGEAGPEAVIPLPRIPRPAGFDGASAPAVGDRHFTFNTYNPVPEKITETAPRVMREAAYVTGAAW